MTEQAYVPYPDEPYPLPAVDTGSGAEEATIIPLREETETDDSLELANDEQSSPALDLYRLYLNQAARTPRLNAEEEVVLAKRIEAGLYAGKLLADRNLYDSSGTVRELLEVGQSAEEVAELLRKAEIEGERARLRFIEANLLLVVSVANKGKFTRKMQSFTLLDLVQEGNDGLMHAVELFDYTKGYKFSTYATNWIEQRIRNALGERDKMITLKRHQQDNVNKMYSTGRQLLASLGREPTDEEWAAAMEISVDKLEHIRNLAELSMPFSLDEQATAQDGRDRHEVLLDEASATEHLVDAALRMDAVKEALGFLTAREAYVLTERLGTNDGEAKDYETIAEKLSISPQLVRETEQRAQTKLRHPSISGRLRQYAHAD